MKKHSIQKIHDGKWNSQGSVSVSFHCKGQVAPCLQFCRGGTTTMVEAPAILAVSRGGVVQKDVVEAQVMAALNTFATCFDTLMQHSQKCRICFLPPLCFWFRVEQAAWLQGTIHTGREHANSFDICVRPVWTLPFTTEGSICVCTFTSLGLASSVDWAKAQRFQPRCSHQQSLLMCSFLLLFHWLFPVVHHSLNWLPLCLNNFPCYFFPSVWDHQSGNLWYVSNGLPDSPSWIQDTGVRGWYKSGSEVTPTTWTLALLMRTSWLKA